MKRMRAGFYPPAFPVPALLKNWKLALVSGMFITGLVAGALLVKSDMSGINKLISSLFDDYYEMRSDQSFLGVVSASFFSALPFFAVAFVAGVSAVGVPVAVLLPAVRGIGIGVISGFLYAGHGLKGVGFSALLIVPQALVSSVSLILACREALGFSAVFFSLLTPNGQPYKMSGDFKMYCARFGVLLLISLLASFIDAMMSSAFLRFFNF